MAREEHHQIWDPAVVNVRIGMGQTPEMGIGSERLRHVFVDEHLQGLIALQTAYFNWLNRGQPFGDPLADWPA